MKLNLEKEDCKLITMGVAEGILWIFLMSELADSSKCSPGSIKNVVKWKQITLRKVAGRLLSIKEETDL